MTAERALRGGGVEDIEPGILQFSFLFFLRRLHTNFVVPCRGPASVP